jgi:hypothetical protein
MHGPFKVAISWPKKPNVLLVEGRTADLYEVVSASFVATYAPRQDSPISEHEVRRRFDRAIQDALGGRGQGQSQRSAAFGKRLRREARKLLEGLATPATDWQVFLPLHAPTVKVETRFGRVAFIPGDSPSAKSLRRQIPEVASAFDVAVVARLNVHAVDAKAAKSIGNAVVRRTLDALDFVEPTVGAPYLEPDAAFEPMEAPGESAVLAVREGVADRTTIAFNVRVRELDGSPRTPLETAIERLLSGEPSPLGRRLSTAIAWAGRANVQRRRDQAFLMKMVALEAATTRDQPGPGVTERLRRRVAQILGGTKEQQDSIYAQMAEFYALRSRIVHAGNAEALTDAIMREATRIVRRVLELLLTAEPFSGMSTEQELEEWFKQQRRAEGKT